MHMTRDRNHLVAGCQIYLAESTLCIPIDLSIVLHAAVIMLHVYLVSDYIVKGVIYIRLTDWLTVGGKGGMETFPAPHRSENN